MATTTSLPPPQWRPHPKAYIRKNTGTGGSNWNRVTSNDPLMKTATTSFNRPITNFIDGYQRRELYADRGFVQRLGTGNSTIRAHLNTAQT